ncbi:MAG: hypothetical protein V1663_05075 [archaeon]
MLEPKKINEVIQLKLDRLDLDLKKRPFVRVYELFRRRDGLEIMVDRIIKNNCVDPLFNNLIKGLTEQDIRYVTEALSNYKVLGKKQYALLVQQLLFAYYIQGGEGVSLVSKVFNHQESRDIATKYRSYSCRNFMQHLSLVALKFGDDATLAYVDFYHRGVILGISDLPKNESPGSTLKIV